MEEGCGFGSTLSLANECEAGKSLQPDPVVLVHKMGTILMAVVEVQGVHAHAWQGLDRPWDTGSAQYIDHLMAPLPCER